MTDSIFPYTLAPPEFRPWPKIARLNRDIVITEKIDGTNACVIVHSDGSVHAQSRNKIITPGKQTDNAGFAAWAYENAEELVRVLGPGYHYGEWWGSGIQRGYGYKNGERFFSLFNTTRWNETIGELGSVFGLRCVPVLYQGDKREWGIHDSLDRLRKMGSCLGALDLTVPAEGIVIFHTASGTLYKVTLENDESPKALAKTSDRNQLGALSV